MTHIDERICNDLFQVVMGYLDGLYQLVPLSERNIETAGYL